MFDRIKNIFGWPWFEPRNPAPRQSPPVDPDPVLPAQTVREYYGDDPAQYIELNLPARRASQPVGAVEGAHGGAWENGAADSAKFVANKVPWLNGLGFAFCSASYRLGTDTKPAVMPPTMAQDLANAFAHLRMVAKEYGIDPKRIARMAHSAGAQLVGTVNTTPALAVAAGPIVGTVYLDSACYDTERALSGPHPSFYDAAFPDQASRKNGSPLALLNAKQAPMLCVASEQRNAAESDADAFVKKAKSFGSSAEVYPVNLSHEDINVKLGTTYDEVSRAFTAKVADFLLPLLQATY